MKVAQIKKATNSIPMIATMGEYIVHTQKKSIAVSNSIAG
jgi:hypothetical protein